MYLQCQNIVERLFPGVSDLVWKPKWQRLLGRELEKAISLGWIMGTRDWLRTFEWSEAIHMEWAWPGKHTGFGQRECSIYGISFVGAKS